MTRSGMRSRSRGHCTWSPPHQVRVGDLGRIRTECCKGAGMRTFAKDDRINGCALLIAGEKPGGMTQKIAHDKQPVHSINTSCHKLGMLVDVFEIILLSSVPG